MTTDKSRPILVVLHQPTSSPGRVGQFLQKAGFELDIRRPVMGEDLPKTLENHYGAVFFGGPMSVNDQDDFLRREDACLDMILQENKPFLGICLGAQMLASHIGGYVHPNQEGSVEAGWYPIDVTEKGRTVMDWPQMVYHFHREGIYDLPKDAEVLATGDAYTNQAFRYGDKAWGLQFHAELTRVMMQRWVVHGEERLQQKGAQPAEAHINGRFVYDPALRCWLISALERIFETKIPD